MRYVLFLAYVAPGAAAVGRAWARLGRLLGPQDVWPALALAAGLALMGAALALRLGLYDRGYLAPSRGTRLTLFLGLTLGATLAVLGLLAALTAWL